MMHLGTQVTIWVAVACWCLAMTQSKPKFFLARRLWTLGLVFYVIHIFFAYGSYYGWSHQVAWEATAKDTAETVGFDSGIGLLVNFAFLAVLLIDLFFQWGRERRHGALWIDCLVLFMILNGAVIFGEGPVRYFGVLLLLGVVVTLLVRKLSRRSDVGISLK